MIYYAIVLFVLLIDQYSKWIIRNNLSLNESYPMIGDVLQITSIRNSGAAYGILEGEHWFFIAITVIMIGGILWYIRKVLKEKKKILAIASCFILGGAIGNFTDRIFYGKVVDFIQFNFHFTIFGHLFYPLQIFNIADSAIFFGVVLILINASFEWMKEKKVKKAY
ncbi:signal peptidase II [Paenibacillus andongensis]|uniref:signal peptidase II n=1 Tax=Paenibacillus andongensis TaxID=2975482 RepID=UPI0021BACFDE|nr:signal peptidase II [Paenibacillus andongensis]